MSEPPVIEAAGLACRRGGRTLFEALSFELFPGDALLLRGPNGSGKSSLLRMLAGFLPRQSGEIRFAQAILEPSEFRSSLVYVGHANPLKPVLSVEDNAAFLGQLAGGTIDRHMFSQFGLDEIASNPARYLSSGQRRRTTLAALLRFDRSVWLLDEPGVGLDRRYRTRLEGVIGTHLEGGGVVIAASHGDISLKDPLILDFAEDDP